MLFYKIVSKIGNKYVSSKSPTPLEYKIGEFTYATEISKPIWLYTHINKNDTIGQTVLECDAIFAYQKGCLSDLTKKFVECVNPLRDYSNTVFALGVKPIREIKYDLILGAKYKIDNNIYVLCAVPNNQRLFVCPYTGLRYGPTFSDELFSISMLPSSFQTNKPMLIPNFRYQDYE